MLLNYAINEYKLVTWFYENGDEHFLCIFLHYFNKFFCYTLELMHINMLHKDW